MTKSRSYARIDSRLAMRHKRDGTNVAAHTSPTHRHDRNDYEGGSQDCGNLAGSQVEEFSWAKAPISLLANVVEGESPRGQFR